ncbi:hypothetical protein PHJA_001030700 [Phtheirospermum japonicum]|uniref:Uncharacterized protein n=1 Tax=Phtheirospermum japonicum TaxID=374723 RepID=A0A830BMW3_9LAMI|nr:hypothetical protein PHJA_001030700 [Phtheirospermum japonicum]
MYRDLLEIFLLLHRPLCHRPMKLSLESCSRRLHQGSPDVEMSGNEIPGETDATTLQPVVDDVLGSTEDTQTSVGRNSPDVIVMSAGTYKCSRNPAESSGTLVLHFAVIHGYEWFTELESPSSCLSGPGNLMHIDRYMWVLANGYGTVCRWHLESMAAAYTYLQNTWAKLHPNDPKCIDPSIYRGLALYNDWIPSTDFLRYLTGLTPRWGVSWHYVDDCEQMKLSEEERRQPYMVDIDIDILDGIQYSHGGVEEKAKEPKLKAAVRLDQRILKRPDLIEEADWNPPSPSTDNPHATPSMSTPQPSTSPPPPAMRTSNTSPPRMSPPLSVS